MKDQIKGKAEELKGKATGDKAEEWKGKAHQKVGDLKDTARGARDDVKDEADRRRDQEREYDRTREPGP